MEQQKDSMIIVALDDTAADQGEDTLHASVLAIRTRAYSILEANVFPPPSTSALTLAEQIKVQLEEPVIS